MDQKPPKTAYFSFYNECPPGAHLVFHSALLTAHLSVFCRRLIARCRSLGGESRKVFYKPDFTSFISRRYKIMYKQTKYKTEIIIKSFSPL